MQFDPDWIGTVATIGLTDDETEEPVPLDKNQPTG